MSKNDFRAGIQQAKAGQLGLKIFSYQAIALAVIAGGLARSWNVAIFTAFGAIIAGVLVSRYPRAQNVAAFIMGLCWAGAAAFLLRDASGGAQAAAIFLGAVLGMGGNVLAFQYMGDLQDK